MTPPEQPTSINLLPQGSEYIVRASGELDLAAAPELEEHLRAAYASGAADVIVDLGDVSFMDSSGLHVLLEAHRHLEEEGRRLLLRGVIAHRRLFDFAGVSGFIHFDD